MPLTASGTIKGVRRILIIHNPTAGRRRRERVQALVQLLRQAGMEVATAETEAAGDAQRFAASASGTGAPPDVIVAAGGDGTVNEIANGLLGSTIPLAIMPLGTVNVLFRELGLDHSVERVAQAIVAGRTALVWPGMANGRALLLMTGVGLDAAIVAAVSPSLKRRFGKLAYIWAAAKLWWRWQPGHRVLRTNGAEHHAAFFIAARCRLYGGSYVSAATARLDEPHLHLVLFERDGRLAALGYALALLIGQLHRWPGVRICGRRVRR
ncbi:MAG TPA: diacylglycerol kinase family protein [Geminicoccus sp.]|jgi:diacylglycerol kinase family enzyme|uniref:diacylglycerol/lipid kinase family protein n=1 Tax=Geminicoccus sp. TaxID=2024832 RepID=UPI002E327A8F|nr:diacylglycerol kinase family protein [Geminicoccus sp.]HEX2527113.1 diacylglycerol kinase family protein [Geminicoccus sp.]